MRMKPDKYTQFKKSKPWGYYPPQVEEKINQYENTINALSDKLLEQRQAASKYRHNIEQLQEELREMHLQMSSLELPEATEAVEHCVLDDFRNYNNPEPIIQNSGINKYNDNKIEDNDDDEDGFIIVQ